MANLDALEIGDNEAALAQLWIRGGYPDSYLANDDVDSFACHD